MPFVLSCIHLVPLSARRGFPKGAQIRVCVSRCLVSSVAEQHVAATLRPRRRGGPGFKSRPGFFSCGASWLGDAVGLSIEAGDVRGRGEWAGRVLWGSCREREGLLLLFLPLKLCCARSALCEVGEVRSPSKRFQNAFKTPSKRVQHAFEMPSKTHSKRLQNAL